MTPARGYDIITVTVPRTAQQNKSTTELYSAPTCQKRRGRRHLGWKPTVLLPGHWEGRSLAKAGTCTRLNSGSLFSGDVFRSLRGLRRRTGSREKPRETSGLSPDWSAAGSVTDR